jgi:nicotinamidase-related amidase
MMAVHAEPYDFEFDPKTAALLIIDMQRDFVYRGGFGEALGNDTSLLLKAVPPTERVLKAARRAGMFTVHTREGHPRAMIDGHRRPAPALFPARPRKDGFRPAAPDRESCLYGIR